MSHTRDIFLDHAATAPVHPQVLGLMLPFFGNHFAAPSSPFSAGDRPRAALAEARGRVAALIGAQPFEIVFTASGTEANNLALLGATRDRRGHVIVSSVEHASVLNPAHRLEELGHDVTVLPADACGLVDPVRLEEALREDTILVSVVHAGNETGVIQGVQEIGRIARARGIPFHCDCVQSAGRIPVDVNVLNADLLSISSHKLYGPKGAGALYIRKGTAVSPVLYGSSQEMGLRPGTVNMPAVVGFGMACEEARADIEDRASFVGGLRGLLERELAARVPGVTIHGSACSRLPHISSISFEGVPADSLAAWLDLEGITVSARASLFSHRPAHRLEAVGIPPDLAPATVRFSPGWENTEGEMRRTAEAAARAAARIREFSSLVVDDPVCVMTFLSRNHVERTLNSLEAAGIPCIVTARPLELEHLGGPRVALAVPCPREGEALDVLASHRISATGMHRLRGMCRRRSDREERFWEKVAEAKRERSGD